MKNIFSGQRHEHELSVTLWKEYKGEIACHIYFFSRVLKWDFFGKLVKSLNQIEHISNEL